MFARPVHIYVIIIIVFVAFAAPAAVEREKRPRNTTKLQVNPQDMRPTTRLRLVTIYGAAAYMCITCF